ncbi:hypothetical protein ACSQ67_021851 [Phaseolus vulgaris]
MERPISSVHLEYVVLFILCTTLFASATTSQHQESQTRQHKEPSYLKMVVNATELPVEEYYDYIIVGGGTAGCPLAATLSQSFKVLVLERGGAGSGNPNLMNQEGFLTNLLNVETEDSPAQAFISEEGVPNARGRVLGGSSAINAGFYSRAHRDFFERSGLPWDLALVNQSYRWVEKEIVFRPKLKTWQSSVRDALLETGVTPYNGFTLDHAKGTKIGGSTFDSSGRRHTSADLLRHARPSNIKVAVHATVERLLLAGSTAIGALFRDQRGRHHRAFLQEHGEVILSAGAIGSPQLLLLSGIGSRPYLSSWGIPVAHHLPYVGHFLYDNPRNGITILPSLPLDHSLIQVVGITDSGAYIEAASNISGPLSAGFLRLASTDVDANPRVRFNYFDNLVDLERCVNGSRKIAEILRSRALKDFKFSNWFGEADFRFIGPALPLHQTEFPRMADFCRRTVSTIWHYHGGCVVGRVVDPHLKVIGVDSLRIVDGSVFSVSPGTNPQATLMMLGRYFGLKMITERNDYK